VNYARPPSALLQNLFETAAICRKTRLGFLSGLLFCLPNFRKFNSGAQFDAVENRIEPGIATRQIIAQGT
jgi:hypothetical protein